MLQRELNKQYFEYPLSKEEWKQLADLIDHTSWEPNNGNGHVRHLVISYDSETSNYIDKQGVKRPFAFSEMTTFLSDEKCLSVLCRDVNDFMKFIVKVGRIANTYLSRQPLTDSKGAVIYDDMGQIRYNKLNNRYLNIYVHNLPFDFQFLISHANVYELFAQSSHKPYYAIIEPGIRFVDTVVLTHKTLDGLGKDLKYFKVRKAVGDFDYDLIRTPETPFTDKEKGYVINDTLVLAAYMKETADQYGGFLSNIPLTQTGIVRRFVRNVFRADPETLQQLLDAKLVPVNMENLVKVYLADTKNPLIDTDKAFQKKVEKEQEHIQDLLGPSGRDFTITTDQYLMMSRAYMGGFTHSNPMNTGKVVKDVQSWDFTSSYPTRILSEKFAMSNPILLKISSEEALKRVEECDNDDTIYLFDYEADSIDSKIDYDYLWSSSKCSASEIAESNGRIMYAEDFKTTMTSIDYDTFKRVYDAENPRITKIYMFRQEYLPLAVILSTLHFYDQKTTLKHVVGKEVSYMLFKQMLNSIYGMMVTSPIRDDVLYTNEQGYQTIKVGDNISEKLDKYNKSMNRFLYYIWGVEISAYSRHELWRGIMECADDYVYSDTDSIKVKNADKHKQFIADYNEEIREKITKCLKSYGLDPALAAPADIKGLHHQIGEWDPLDGYYSYFKTLGAKRYIDIDKKTNNFQITIAGLSKSKGAKYVIDQTGVDHDGNTIKAPSRNYKKLFDYFNDGMFVPADQTGKLAHFYVDQYDGFDVKDYRGQTYHIEAGSGTLLKAVDFSMSISQRFLDVLAMYADGFIEDPNDRINALD